MSLQKSEKLSSNLIKLEILVDEKIFKKACEDVYNKERKRIRVPGFRNGKAPKKVIEKIYGKNIFYENAINIAYRKDLDDAIKELKLDVVDVNKFDVIYANEEKGLCYSVNCVLKPKIEVKNYKEIEVEKVVREVKKEDIDEEILKLRERVARIIDVEEERACVKGDLVYLDFTGFLNGISFKGGTSKNYKLKLGSNQFIKGFEEQVIGHKINEEFNVEVVFPKDYHVQDLREKNVLFKCKINAIKKVELPQEDDEFAKDVSEFDSLEKLRENIKINIKKSHEDTFERILENKVLYSISSNISGDIPDVMFEKECDELVRNFKNSIERKGLNFKKYLEDSGIEEDDVRNDFYAQAIHRVKVNLALEEIAKLENLNVTEEEVGKELERLSKEYKIKLEDIKNIFSTEILKKDILTKKTIDFIKSNAKIIEKIPNVEKK